MLSKSNLDASYSVRTQEVRKVIKGVFESAGTQIDIGKVSFLAALKSVMAMTWGDSGRLIGKDGVDLEVKFREVMDELMVLIGTPNVSDLFPVLGRFDLQGIAKRTKKVMGVSDEILNSAIEEQRKMRGSGVEKGGYLQMLLELEDNDDSSDCGTNDQFEALLLYCPPPLPPSVTTTPGVAISTTQRFPTPLVTALDTVVDDHTGDHRHP
ncbi:unnamed protein product [Citrullus colocynthis]|uniref:Uncharacterized protein n=1 Tax=Citrullus colocynthis TaxID=252529 RepID=A0ABP0XSA6_9ROSI